MSRRMVLAAVAALGAASANAAPPPGHTTIYDAPTRVNMGGRPVTADIALYADRRPQRKATSGSFSRRT